MARKNTVLVAETNALNLNIIGNLLSEIGYEPVLADSCASVFKYLETEYPDLILLDASMQDYSSVPITEQLQANLKYSNVPIVMTVTCDHAGKMDEIFNSGAVDYVFKPFSRLELASRLKMHIELKNYNDTLLRLGRNISRAYDELSTASSILNSKDMRLNLFIDELDKASKTDFLTGLNNRRHMIARINDEVIRARSTGRTFALLLGDLDRFKAVNDTYGHDCGDEVLRSVSKLFKSMVREHDSVARWGGEEFLFLIVEVGEKEALSFGERIRSKVENTPIFYNGERIKITMTIGVSLLGSEPDTADNVILRADQALYAGKNDGRNKVVMIEPPK